MSKRKVDDNIDCKNDNNDKSRKINENVTFGLTIHEVTNYGFHFGSISDQKSSNQSPDQSSNQLHSTISDVDNVVCARALAAQHRIKVNCDPPVYLHNNLLSNSDVLRIAYSMAQKESPIYDSFGDRLFVIIEHDGISAEEWTDIKNMLSPMRMRGIPCKPYTIDNLLYICNKYNISLSSMGIHFILEQRIRHAIYRIRFIRMNSQIANPMYYNMVVNIYKDVLKKETTCKRLLLSMFHLPRIMYNDILKNCNISIS